MSAGMAGELAAAVRDAANVDRRQPKTWDLNDLVAVGDIATDLGVTKAQVCMWIARTRTSGFPTALATPSCGDLYSRNQVHAWWKVYRNSPGRRGGLQAIETKRERGIPTSPRAVRR